MAGANLLMLIVRYGQEKNYILDKLNECLTACVRRPGVDIVWAGDRPNDDFAIDPGLFYTDDIVTPARYWVLQEAARGGYDGVIWQGMDALYQTRDDFTRLISHRDLPIVSVVISARTDVDYACARRWRVSGGILTPCQDDIPPKELASGKIIKAGWPSADNIVIRPEVYECADVLRPEVYIPWYQRQSAPFPGGNARDRNAAHGKLASSERLCFEAAARGHQAYIDTSIRVWHVHESGDPNGNGPLARLWPDIEVPVGDVTWK